MSTTVDIQVNTTVSGNQQRPTTLLQSDNTFWVIWESDAAGATGIYARHYNSNGNPLGGEIQLVAGGASWPYAERLPDDGWVLIWDGDDGDQSGVFGQRFDAGGNPVGSSFQANTTTADSQESAGRLTVLEGGGWVVMWHSVVSEFPIYSTNGVWGRVYDPNGQPVTAEFRIDTVSGAYHYPYWVDSLAGGGWLATWVWTDDYTDWHAYGQRYDAQGAPVGAPFAITPDSTSHALFAPLPDGGWIAGWSASNAEDTDGGVFIQRFGSNGNPVGDTIKVNTTTDGNQFFPGDIALLSDVGWVIFYGTYNGPGTNDFYGQRYDANGTPVGDEFLITSTAEYSGWGAPLADGGWVNVWMNNDGSAIGLAARVYDASGNPVGEEFQVNAYTDGHQFPLSYEAFPDGSWVVIWESFGQDGSDNGVYMRLFDAGSGSDGGTTIVGTPGNDIFVTSLADENFNGVAGIDTVIFSGIRSDYSLSKTTGGYQLQDTVFNRGGTDTLVSIERLQFSDKKVALDLAPTDNAGQALLFIGVLAPDLVASPEVVGLILGFVDGGMNMQQLNQMAFDIGLMHDLAGGSSNTDVARMAFENVVGEPATPDWIDLLVGFMDGRSANFTQSEFLTAVANLEVNQVNVDLVGLAQTGIEYTFG